VTIETEVKALGAKGEFGGVRIREKKSGKWVFP
jgi:hypothetical protein